MSASANRPSIRCTTIARASAGSTGWRSGRANSVGRTIEIIDEDLGRSGAGIKGPGFERMLGALCDGRVGAVFCVEASRLARNGRDWHTLLEFCSFVGALLIDADGIHDPRDPNDRLLLRMKGQISEMEPANFRARAQAALAQKARRGELIQRVAVGYVRAADGRLEKTPDARVRGAIELVFGSSMNSAARAGLASAALARRNMSDHRPRQRAADKPHCSSRMQRRFAANKRTIDRSR